MKLSNLLRGKRAESPPVDVVGFGFSVLLVPLTGIEHETACIAARDRAKAKGVEEPAIGDPIYDLAFMAAVLVDGCLDPDSPPDARTKSFESIEEILDAMHPEHVVFLHEHHERWQDECSPSVRKIGSADLLAKVREVASADGLGIFMRFSPSTRWNFVRSMAITLLGVLEASSTRSSASAAISPISESSKPKTPRSAKKKRSGARG